MSAEVFGDATRGDSWAAVRLEVDGERIVAADAPGLERSLVGHDVRRGGDSRRRASRGRGACRGSRARVPRRTACGPCRRRHERRSRQCGGAPSCRQRRDRRDTASLAGSRRARHRARMLLARGSRGGTGDVSCARRPACDARPPRGVQADDRRPVRRCLSRRGDSQSVHALQRGVSIRRARGICESCGSRRAVDGPLCADRRA